MKKFALFSAALISFSALPASQVIAKFQDWGIERDGEYLAFSTRNKDGNYLGKICSQSDLNCFYLITQPDRCETGTKSLTLVNTSAGASAIEFSCTGKLTLDGRTHYGLVFNFDEIAEILNSSNGIIGFALANASGAFSVQRYSMNGFKSGASRMLQEEEKMISRAQQKNKIDARGSYL